MQMKKKRGLSAGEQADQVGAALIGQDDRQPIRASLCGTTLCSYLICLLFLPLIHLDQIKQNLNAVQNIMSFSTAD